MFATLSPAAYGMPSSSTSSLALGKPNFWDVRHSSRCRMVSCCGFNLHFPNDKWCRAPFQVFICNLMTHLFQSFAHFLLGSYLNFEFPESFIYGRCNFFQRQEFLILMKSNLSSFSSIDCAFGFISRISLPKIRSFIV